MGGWGEQRGCWTLFGNGVRLGTMCGCVGTMCVCVGTMCVDDVWDDVWTMCVDDVWRGSFGKIAKHAS